MISIERVEELRSEVGEADFAEIVALFMAESDALVGELGRARDPAAAEALLHALKGSALNLGFDELARLCQEGRGAAAGSAEWQARVAQLAEAYEQSKRRLAELP